MGLFQHKKSQFQSAEEEAAYLEQHFIDENFREELRNHGRLYFEKIINENADLFKKDLDATILQINVDLKDHVIRRLDDAVAEINATLKDSVSKQLENSFLEYGKAFQQAQDAALQTLGQSSQQLLDQHKQLGEALQKNFDEQSTTLANASQENVTQLKAMQDAQNAAVTSLANSAKAMEQQYQEFSTTLKKNLADQEASQVHSFEENMAQVIEHYLLGALGDQYDLKAQLPSIIDQLEANKQAILDDMKA